MRCGLHYMLMAPLDDADQTIMLFPGWPAQWCGKCNAAPPASMHRRWDVSFKLLGPRNTTVEAACVGGKLAYLIVTPPSRLANVQVLNCQQ